MMIVSDDDDVNNDDDIIIPGSHQSKTQQNYDLPNLKSKDIFDENDFIISPTKKSQPTNQFPKKVIPSLNPNPSKKPVRKLMIQEISDSESESDEDPDWASKPRFAD